MAGDDISREYPEYKLQRILNYPVLLVAQHCEYHYQLSLPLTESAGRALHMVYDSC